MLFGLKVDDECEVFGIYKSRLDVFTFTAL